MGHSVLRGSVAQAAAFQYHSANIELEYEWT